MERIHGRKRYQLHTDCTILGCTVQRIQRLQAGTSISLLFSAFLTSASDLLFKHWGGWDKVRADETERAVSWEGSEASPMESSK